MVFLDAVDVALKSNSPSSPPDCQPNPDPHFGAGHGQRDLPTDCQVQTKLQVSMSYSWDGFMVSLFQHKLSYKSLFKSVFIDFRESNN